MPDQSVKIWNYITNTCELNENFADLNIGLKPLSAVALHPSGYYMAVALVDHVCLYHILHGEFRKFHTIEIKHVKKVRFSSGGQFFVIADHKKMFFFNTFSLEKIKDMACPSQNISNLAFNPDDSEMVFISSDGMV